MSLCSATLFQVQNRDRDPAIDPLCFQCRASDNAVHSDHSMPVTEQQTASSSNLSRGSVLV